MDKRKYFFYKWRIENFNFCWQKTGEHLESPLFDIESPSKTSWRLWLYPRGEDDGEYISCYLFRADGGPEVVDVDFELSVSVGEWLVKPPVSFEQIYSFKNHQKEGEKSFVLRREILVRVPDWEKACTLTIGCRIFNRGEDRYYITERFGRTTIATESISGMDVLDYILDLNTEKSIEVKAFLEADAFISINLSRFGENLRIEIQPICCKKIKYVCCKITVIKGWDRNSPIEHVRSWVGEIKTDIWQYQVPPPPTELENDEDVATRAPNTFFFYYDFSYSAGVEYSNNELNDYGTDLWIDNVSLLESSGEHVEAESFPGYATAVDSLQTLYASGSFADVNIETQDSNLKAHKAVLCSRSCELARVLEDSSEINASDLSDDIVRRLLQFLYTDKVEFPNYPVAVGLYNLATSWELEYLKKKCRSYFEMYLRPKHFAELWHTCLVYNDLALKASLMKYVVAHDEEVFSTDEWQQLSNEHWSDAEKCMLMKHQRKSKNH